MYALRVYSFFSFLTLRRAHGYTTTHMKLGDGCNYNSLAMADINGDQKLMQRLSRCNQTSGHDRIYYMRWITDAVVSWGPLVSVRFLASSLSIYFDDILSDSHIGSRILFFFFWYFSFFFILLFSVFFFLVSHCVFIEIILFLFILFNSSLISFLFFISFFNFFFIRFLSLCPSL